MHVFYIYNHGRNICMYFTFIIMAEIYACILHNICISGIYSCQKYMHVFYIIYARQKYMHVFSETRGD